MNENPSLFEAFAAYVRAGSRLLAMGPAPRRMTEPMDEWVRSDELFRRTQRVRIDWGLSAIANELHATEEHKVLTALLQQDPRTAPFIDRMVGTKLHGSRRIGGSFFTDEGLRRCLDLAGGPNVGGQIIQLVFDEIVDFTQRRSVQLRCVAPIQGLVMAEESVQLEDGPTLRRLSDEEISLCLGGGLLPSFAWSGFSFVTEMWGASLTYEVPRYVGAELNSFPAESVADAQRGREEFLALGRVLRLAQSGEARVTGFLRYEDDPANSGISVSPFLPSDGSWAAGPYRVDAAVAQDISELWTQVWSAGVEARSHLVTAIRRFSDAPERRDVRDRLVDLVIAAEAFLLGGDSEADRGENAFRLSLRLACFSTTERAERRRLLKLMRQAYRARNVIVHGGSSLDRVIEEPRLRSFVGELDEALRYPLRKMIALAASAPGRSPLVDWDELIVGIDPGVPRAPDPEESA